MKYFIQRKYEAEYEVTKDAFVDEERLNGFYNTLGFSREPATSGFTGAFSRGRVEYENPEDFSIGSVEQ